MTLISIAEMGKILGDSKIDRYYVDINMNGALTIHLPPDLWNKTEQIMHKFIDVDKLRTSDDIDEMLYPVYKIDFDDSDDEEILQWFKEKKVFYPVYHQQLNTWFNKKNDGVQEKDVNPSRIAFYSYKGGVGRSTAMAVVARLLAKDGLVVAVLDLDLEAPGLNSLLLTTPKTSPFGVVDYLYHYPWAENGIDKDRFLSQYVIKEEVPRLNDVPGQLWVMTAGGTQIRQETDALRLLFSDADEVELSLGSFYLEKLSYIDFDLYVRQRTPVFERLLQDIADYTNCDVILMDSRTGLSNLSGALLNKYSNFLSLHIQDNRQNREGIEFIVKYVRDINKLASAVWCHTKVPKEYDKGKSQLTDFIKSAVNRSFKNDILKDEYSSYLDDINLHYLPYDSALEDISAVQLQQYVENDRIPLAYKLLADHIIEIAGLNIKLPHYISAKERKNIIGDLLKLVESNKRQAIYIAQRFLNPDLIWFIGFPGSGKKTFARYMSNIRGDIKVITFQEFQELVGKTRHISSRYIFLDWSYKEATQAVCKWLLQSDVFLKWVGKNVYFASRLEKDNLLKMKNEPDYELPHDLAETILAIVFGKASRGSRLGVVWRELFLKLQYRKGYVLPGDLINGVRNIMVFYLNKKNMRGIDSIRINALFPPVHLNRLREIKEQIGEPKKQWLASYDQRLLQLIEVYKDIRVEYLRNDSKEKNMRNFLQVSLNEKYPNEFDNETFVDVLDKAVSMGIFWLNDKKSYDLYLSPVYNLMF